jgi:hypothetical protein
LVRPTEQSCWRFCPVREFLLPKKPHHRPTLERSLQRAHSPASANPLIQRRPCLYGQFVQAAYSMYGAAPNNLTPPPSPDFPAGYDLVAWVQMQDFIIGSIGPTFYGFIAQSTANPNQFVLAIRGTSNGVEWWDDLNAAVLIPFRVPGCGSVGAGFARIR